MSRVLTIVVMLILTPSVYASGSGGMGGGGMGGGGGMSESGATPGAPHAKTSEQLAVQSYDAGLNHKKRATQYEQKAASAKDEKERDKQLAKAKEEYTNAIADYKKAIGLNNKAYQAMNELGYAFRKTGDYESSVKAYNAALIVRPDFTPAIEYRGEAYLALGQFDKVKESYLTLFRDDQDHAAILMKAMDAWIEQHPDQSAPDAKAFSDWVTERKTVAAQTQSLSMNNVHAWN
jgi:tetratricopeptide (TPR) repeat protein